MTEQEYIDMLNNQKEYGFAVSAILGQSIIERAKECEKKEGELPYLIADIKTLRYHVQLTYTGLLGDLPSFSLVDLNSPEGGSHGYPKVFFGDTVAFVMEIIRELNYITVLHKSNQ